MSRQNVDSGDESVNLQAGQSISYTVHNGPSLEELKTYVHGVFAENFLRLTGEAERIAEERARQVTEDFLNELHDQDPRLLESMREPAMLSAVYEAQSSYARSGEADLAAILVGLLLDRARETTRNLRSIVLEGAISVAPRITALQREALAMVFAVHHFTELTETREEYVEKRVIDGFLPLTVNLQSVTQMDVQHLEYVGCGSSSLGYALQERLAPPRYFARAFDPTTLSEGLQGLDPTIPDPDSPHGDLRVFAPWVHDLRMRESMRPLIAPYEDEIKERIRVTKFDPKACLDALRPWVPHIDKLSSLWQNSGLEGFSLTSVGLAIGHSYWADSVSESSPLSDWIP